jgi:hypothetical protein
VCEVEAELSAEHDVDECDVQAQISCLPKGFGGRRGEADDVDSVAFEVVTDGLKEMVVVVDEQGPQGCGVRHGVREVMPDRDLGFVPSVGSVIYEGHAVGALCVKPRSRIALSRATVSGCCSRARGTG